MHAYKTVIYIYVISGLSVESLPTPEKHYIEGVNFHPHNTQIVKNCDFSMVKENIWYSYVSGARRMYKRVFYDVVAVRRNIRILNF